MNRITPQELTEWLPVVRIIARKAGAIIMDYYKNGAAVTIKGDGSPVTEADHASDKFITACLKELTPHIAIVSEESEAQPEIARGQPFWTVDPLDGTKGFVGRTGGFYVKIALLDNLEPVLGVVYQPATDTLYFSLKDGNAYRQQGDAAPEIIRTRGAPEKGTLSTLFNLLHHEPAAYDAARGKLRQRGIDVPERKDAQGKCATAFNMAVASGQADAYLDCGAKAELENGNGFSWDYAADSLILKNAGGLMVEINSGREPVFDRPASLMNAMISLGDRELGIKSFPELKSGCV